MIKIGDAAVSEQQIVEDTTMSSTEKKDESKNEKDSTSTKKAAPKTQSRGTARAKLIREPEDEEVSLFKENIYIVFVEVDSFSVLLSSLLSGEDIVVVSTTFSSLTAASPILINSNFNYS